VRGDIFGPIGNILIRSFLKEIADKIYAKRGGNKILYEIGSILCGSFLFQLLKYLH
jgi:hypothetical protein